MTGDANISTNPGELQAEVVTDGQNIIIRHAKLFSRGDIRIELNDAQGKIIIESSKILANRTITVVAPFTDNGFCLRYSQLDAGLDLKFNVSDKIARMLLESDPVRLSPNLRLS